MSSSTLLISRHGEKPDLAKPELGPGFTSKGAEDKHSLVVRGWQRAGAWAALFGLQVRSDDYSILFGR
jgi:hypothetical protein